MVWDEMVEIFELVLGDCLILFDIVCICSRSHGATVQVCPWTEEKGK